MCVYVTADFGLSKIIGPEVQMQTVCGTPGYCGKCLTTPSLYLTVCTVSTVRVHIHRTIYMYKYIRVYNKVLYQKKWA